MISGHLKLLEMDEQSSIIQISCDIERPKTSRRIAHPTPEQFTNYIIPSPCQKENQKHVLNLEDKFSRPNSSSGRRTEEKELVALGCWLFGSGVFA